MAKTDNCRIMITISKEMLQQLDSYCSGLGVSKSSFIVNTIAEKFYAIDSVKNIAKEFLADNVNISRN